MIVLKHIRLRNSWGTTLNYIAGVITPVIAAVIGFKDNINPDSYPLISKLIYSVNEKALWLYLGSLLIYFIGKVLTYRGRSVTWEALQTQIDMLQRIAFEGLQNELNDHHRVTLFKHRIFSLSRFKSWNFLRCLYDAYQYKWHPWSGWLTPLIRSGHTGKTTKAVFLAPDEGSKAEGIAGKCWASDHTVKIDKLPNVTSSTSTRNLEKYCANSNMPMRMLEQYTQQNKHLAKNILAFPVKTSTGNRWGVLVIDSSSITGIQEEKAREAFTTIIETVGVLVEDIK